MGRHLADLCPLPGRQSDRGGVFALLLQCPTFGSVFPLTSRTGEHSSSSPNKRGLLLLRYVSHRGCLGRYQSPTGKRVARAHGTGQQQIDPTTLTVPTPLPGPCAYAHGAICANRIPVGFVTAASEVERCTTVSPEGSHRMGCPIF